jgi:hypothetical protein
MRQHARCCPERPRPAGWFRFQSVGVGLPLRELPGTWSWVVIGSVCGLLRTWPNPATTDSLERERIHASPPWKRCFAAGFCRPESARYGGLACPSCRVRLVQRSASLYHCATDPVPLGRAAGLMRGRAPSQPCRPSQSSPSMACCPLLGAERALKNGRIVLRCTRETPKPRCAPSPAMAWPVLEVVLVRQRAAFVGARPRRCPAHAYLV